MLQVVLLGIEDITPLLEDVQGKQDFKVVVVRITLV